MLALVLWLAVRLAERREPQPGFTHLPDRRGPTLHLEREERRKPAQPGLVICEDGTRPYSFAKLVRPCPTLVAGRAQETGATQIYSYAKRARPGNRRNPALFIGEPGATRPYIKGWWSAGNRSNPALLIYETSATWSFTKSWRGARNLRTGATRPYTRGSRSAGRRRNLALLIRETGATRPDTCGWRRAGNWGNPALLICESSASQVCS